MCLGLVPMLGDPARPLHWAVTAGMVAFGGLLGARHRLGRTTSQLGRVDETSARSAGRVTLVVCALIAAAVAVIFGARLRSGGSIGLLSLGMPFIALVWVSSLGLKAWRHREPAPEPAGLSDRPSRRPPSWDAVPSAKPGQSGSPNRQVSA
jgi:hypothetical protein